MSQYSCTGVYRAGASLELLASLLSQRSLCIISTWAFSNSAVSARAVKVVTVAFPAFEDEQGGKGYLCVMNRPFEDIYSALFHFSRLCLPVSGHRSRAGRRIFPALHAAGATR